MLHDYSSSTWETEAGRSQVQGQPREYRKQNKKLYTSRTKLFFKIETAIFVVVLV